MHFEASRLRRGEWIAAAAAVLLAVCLFVLAFYRVGGTAGGGAASRALGTTASGWSSLPTLRWLILLTVLAGLALAYFQGARPAPALPASLSVITTVLGALASLGLVYRVLISVPGPDGLVTVKLGGYLALLSALVLTAGAFASLREEDRPDEVRNAAIPTVPLERR